MRIRVSISLGLCLLALVSAGRAAEPSLQPTLHERTAPACVEVLMGGQLAGSGWFTSPDGLVVTARHVIASSFGGRRIEVMLDDAARKPAELVATDPGHDLAVLRIAPGDQPYPFLELAERVPPAGERVYLFGQMMFRHGLMMPGTVASDRAAFEYLPQSKAYARVRPVAPALVGGSSGGPWVDRQGRVVGNQVSTIALGSSPVGLSFMAELDGIRRLVRRPPGATDDATVHPGNASEPSGNPVKPPASGALSPPTATLGLAVEELWEHAPGVISQFPEGTSGLLPAIVHEDGPARKAGLNKKTLIVSIDGHPTRYRDELLRYVRGRQPGDRVTLSVLDAGESTPRDVSVELGRLAD